MSNTIRSIAQKLGPVYAVGRWIRRLKNYRIVQLDENIIPESRINDVYNSPMYNGVAEDLVAFTGLSKEQVDNRLRRLPKYHFESEFKWRAPKDYKELAWFYRSGYGYLFANAIHAYWNVLDFLKPEDGPVLEYAGGIGCNTFELARRGFRVDHLEISIIQADFARFRAKRKGYANVEILEPFHNMQFDPVHCITREYGAIILEDVIEHVPDYPKLLSHLIAKLRPKGYIVENTAFGVGRKKVDTHMDEKVPLAEAMKGMKKIQPHIWKKET